MMLTLLGAPPPTVWDNGREMLTGYRLPNDREIPIPGAGGTRADRRRGLGRRRALSGTQNARGRVWRAFGEALPEEFSGAAERLKHGDPAGLETIIEFLEADPMSFRSGYLKADVLRWLNRVPLTTKQTWRLRAVVVNVVASEGWRREFNRYCLLAKRLDAPEFRLELEALATSRDAGIQARARQVLETLDNPAGVRRYRRWARKNA